MQTDKERLIAQKNEIIRRRDFRNKGFEEQKQRIRDQYRRMPPEWAEVEIKNSFSSSMAKIARVELEEQQRLDDIDRQLAALDKLEGAA